MCLCRDRAQPRGAQRSRSQEGTLPGMSPDCLPPTGCSDSSPCSWPHTSLWGLLPVGPATTHPRTPHTPSPSLLILGLGLQGPCMLQWGQQKVGTALQVGTRHGELHVGHQLLDAGKVWGLTEVLQVLVQPGAQNGGDGTGGRWTGSRVSAWTFLAHSPLRHPGDALSRGQARPAYPQCHPCRGRSSQQVQLATPQEPSITAMSTPAFLRGA